MPIQIQARVVIVTTEKEKPTPGKLRGNCHKLIGTKNIKNPKSRHFKMFDTNNKASQIICTLIRELKDIIVIKTENT